MIPKSYPKYNYGDKMVFVSKRDTEWNDRRSMYYLPNVKFTYGKIYEPNYISDFVSNDSDQIIEIFDDKGNLATLHNAQVHLFFCDMKTWNRDKSIDTLLK